MPKLPNSTPEGLRPYTFLGLELNWNTSTGQALGACPFCSKENKFYVSETTGQYDCKVCGDVGNIYTFIRRLWEESSNTPESDYRNLAKDRSLLGIEQLQYWGARKSLLTDDWIIPGYNPEGKINNLYSYRLLIEDGVRKRKLMAIPTLKHGLFNVNQFDDKKSQVFLLEGPWDGMVLSEVLGSIRIDPTGNYRTTANESLSLKEDVNVLAVPGCNVFRDDWSKLLVGKKVLFLYDNDHPHIHPQTGKQIEGAAWAGMRRAVTLLAAQDEKPECVSCVRWGEEGYDPKLQNGFDVRDMLGAGLTIPIRASLLGTLLGRTGPIPEEWLEGRDEIARKQGSLHLTCLPCEQWSDMILAWRKALKWTEGLDRALSVMFSCIVSTKAVGDQLWCKIMGPAGSGKSTLCEALSVARKYVIAKSTLKGFHSGFRSDPAGMEDNSLIIKAKDKTLVIKDGDTLLSMPNLTQILSEARDLYDRNTRSYYKNKMSKEYLGVNMTLILCGTGSLRKLDSSELGERFLDCVIMEGVDDDLEDNVLLQKAYQAERSLNFESNGEAKTQNTPEIIHAMQLTGGYVEYLRENANDLLNQVNMPDWVIQRCICLGKFVAYARARPSKTQDEVAEREFATRLVSQLVRLAKCLTVVMNKRVVNKEIMDRVEKVAMNTARGHTNELIKVLYHAGTAGLDAQVISIRTGYTEDHERKTLRYLRRIGVVEYEKPKPGQGESTRVRWRLTEKVRKLYIKMLYSDNTEQESE